MIVSFRFDEMTPVPWAKNVEGADVSDAPSGFGRGWGMTDVETVAWIRFEHFQNRKWLSGSLASWAWRATVQGAEVPGYGVQLRRRPAGAEADTGGDTLTTILEAEAKAPRRERHSPPPPAPSAPR